MIYTHLFVILADLGDSVSQFWIGVGSLVLSALAILVTVFVAMRNRQKKVLTYEIASNSSVVNLDKDVSSSTVSLLLNGRPVTNVRVYVIKLFNAGNTSITPQDYPDDPSFEFSSPPYSRPLISCEVQDTGIAAKLPVRQLKGMLSIDNTEQKTVTLKPPLLNPRDSLSLRILLMADKRDSANLNIRGQIKDGEIKKYAAPPVFLTWRAIVIGVCIAFVLGLLISNSFGLITAFINHACAVGSIQVAGSTAFSHTAMAEATNYNTTCPSQLAHISFPTDPNNQGSGNGLQALERGNVQIADSELSTTYSDQTANPVAVVVFALIVNKVSLPDLSGLTTEQIQCIYQTAHCLDWSPFDPGVSAAGTNILVVERAPQSASGTQATFDKYVLGGTEIPKNQSHPQVDLEPTSAAVASKVANTPGAIGYVDLEDVSPYVGQVTVLDIDLAAPTISFIEKSQYKFWTTEYMYTSKNPTPLATSFISYVKQNVQTNDAIINLAALNPDPTTLRSPLGVS